MFCYMSGRTMDEINYRYLMIRMKDPKDHALIDQIGKELEKAVGAGVKVLITYKQVSSNNSVTNIVNYIFYLTIAVMMFLCFFSLTASMSANLYDQSKEIGVLRSMGVTKGRIRILYFYEALILVNASCLLGIFIGTTVGFTMALQQNLFLKTELHFFYPWLPTLEILGLSIICAFFATFGPASQIVSK